MICNYKGIQIKRNIETLDFMQREYSANEVKMNTYFSSCFPELVYVASEEDEEINRLLENHLGFINKVAYMAAEEGYPARCVPYRLEDTGGTASAYYL